MTLCPVCWLNGRSLMQGCCLCTGDVLTNSAFYEWMGEKLQPLPERIKQPKPVFTPKKMVFKFGEKPAK